MCSQQWQVSHPSRVLHSSAGDTLRDWLVLGLQRACYSVPPLAAALHTGNDKTPKPTARRA